MIRDQSILRSRRLAAGALVALLVALADGPPGRAAVDAKYHTYAELTSALQTLAKTYPQLVRVTEMGKTRQGRSLWVVQISAPGPQPVEARPAVLVVANLEGDGLTGSELALQIADRLASGYAADAATKRQLDTTVFYIVPRLNPDAAEDYFAAVRTGRRTTFTPHDDDNDGRVDEDGPEDLNGDGLITTMRVRDPRGPFTPLEDDARLLKRADPQKGEAGGWAVYWEGIDNDGDGFYNEDGVGGADLDRNYPHQYPFYAPDAGRHMVSEAETRALIDFAIAHGHIGAIFTFGASDNLVTAPGGRGATIDLPAFASDATTAARESGVVRDPPAAPFFGGGSTSATWRRPRGLRRRSARLPRGRPPPSTPPTSSSSGAPGRSTGSSPAFARSRPHAGQPGRSSSGATSNTAYRRSLPRGGEPSRRLLPRAERHRPTRLRPRLVRVHLRSAAVRRRPGEAGVPAAQAVRVARLRRPVAGSSRRPARRRPTISPC